MDTIKTYINSAQYIEWASADDCLLFWAHFSNYPNFSNLYTRVTGKQLILDEYASYRSLLRADDLARVIKTTKVKRKLGMAMSLLSYVLKKQLEGVVP